MAELNLTHIPGAETGEIPGFPLERDERLIINFGVADPVWDVDTLPLTYTNSRWSAFIYRADERDLKRILPEPLEIEDDLVEFWYNDVNHNTLGPFFELGVTIAASYGDYKAGYYAYMYLTSDCSVFAGRERCGAFPKKVAYVTITEHGGKLDDTQELPGNDFFSFMAVRRGYLMHTATGRYSGNRMDDLPSLPIFYGKTDWGRMNMRIVTSPDLRSSRWDLFYFPPLLEGRPRMVIKPETIRTARAEDIRTWYLAATPFDNVGALIPPRKLIGLVAFNFDMIITPAQSIWNKTVTRTDEDIANLSFATPYRYSMRHRFPKPVG